MKKIYIVGIIMGVCNLFSSCNEEWNDELYTEMISLKASPGSNGVHDIYIRYQPDGTGSFKLPVIVSGSQTNGRDINVKISVDNDTLPILNIEKFSAREDLWYRQLPEKYYSFPTGNTCHIPAGKSTQTYDINFNLKGIDLNEKWVLPLTIDKDPSYVQNMRKGYYKALLNLHLFNDYSGVYAANSMNIYLGENTNDPATVPTRELRVVDEKTAFFYAGTRWEEDENRDKYKVAVSFGEGSKDADGVETGPITITSMSPENPTQIEAYGNCSYRRSVEKHPTEPFMEKHITVIYINYYYTDNTSDPLNPIRYRATGSMAMQRTINTLIPDQDQAIQW